MGSIGEIFKGLYCYGCPLFMHWQILKNSVLVDKNLWTQVCKYQNRFELASLWALSWYLCSVISFQLQVWSHIVCRPYKRHKVLQSQILSGIIFHSLSPPACKRQVKYEQMDWTSPGNHSHEKGASCGTTHVFLRVVNVTFLKIKSSFSSDLH